MTRTTGQPARSEAALFAAVLFAVALAGAIHEHPVAPGPEETAALGDAGHVSTPSGVCPACAIGRHLSTPPSARSVIPPAEATPTGAPATAFVAREARPAGVRTPRAPPVV